MSYTSLDFILLLKRFAPALVVFLCLAIYWRWARYQQWRRLGAQKIAIGPDLQNLDAVVDRLARRARLTKPELAIVEDFSPNALVLKMPRADYIVLTRGALQSLSTSELEGILALCLARLRSRERFRSQLAFALAYPLARGGELAPEPFRFILNTAAAASVRLILSVNRWYQADLLASEIASRPDAVASGLRRMTALSHRVPLQNRSFATDHLWVIGCQEEDWIGAAGTTHPPVEERVRRLLDRSLSCVRDTVLQ